MVKYSDHTLFGVTHTGSSNNGVFQIYSSSTGAIVGTIQQDAQVTTTFGVSLGICSGAVISDQGLIGECVLPTNNPDHAETYIPSTPSTSGCSGGTSYTTTPDGCEDLRDGSFDASWNQSTCNLHGYFYCTVSNSCTDQTININSCL